MYVKNIYFAIIWYDSRVQFFHPLQTVLLLHFLRALQCPSNFRFTSLTIKFDKFKSKKPIPLKIISNNIYLI